MASKTIAHIPAADINLKRTFENAVRDIYDAAVNRKSPQYRTPIVQRSRGPVESSANTQKKALTDAAKALAQLWKVSPSR